MTANSRKVLVPLATLLVAGAVAIGSGATWTSTTSSSVTVTSGTLLHHNDHDGATLTISNIKPGDTATGTVVITNTGTLDSTLAFKETVSSSTFNAAGLNLEITQDGVEVYDGDFGGLTDGADVTLDDADLDVSDTSTFVFTVSMPANADDSNQNKSASATFNWVTTQDGGTSLLENWV